MHHKRGKTLTIFLALNLIVLCALIAIYGFFYQTEKQKRHEFENELEKSHASEAKLQADLKESHRQLAIAQDKKKEVDDKINSLMDEMELNEGLRKELKTENASLKEAVEAAKKEKDKAKGDLEEAERRYKEATELFKSEQDKNNALQKTVKELEEAKSDAEKKINVMKDDLKPYNQQSAERQIAAETIDSGRPGKSKIELDKIVVNPNDGTRGKVLSVDKEAEFIVCNLGLKQGIKAADVLSVYRGEEYLGDVRVSRVQDELSAADIIPPFSSRKVRKNDVVVFKP